MYTLVSRSSAAAMLSVLREGVFHAESMETKPLLIVYFNKSCHSSLMSSLKPAVLLLDSAQDRKHDCCTQRYSHHSNATYDTRRQDWLVYLMKLKRWIITPWFDSYACTRQTDILAVAESAGKTSITESNPQPMVTIVHAKQVTKLHILATNAKQ